jgi:hypothetical protein
MSITYTWEITGLKTKNLSELKPEAVIQTYWKKIGTDAEGRIGTFSGATPFTLDPNDDSGPFIQFEELTEQDDINWIQTVVIGDYETHVNSQIEKQIQDQITPTVDASLPWANTPSEE